MPPLVQLCSDFAKQRLVQQLIAVCPTFVYGGNLPRLSAMMARLCFTSSIRLTEWLQDACARLPSIMWRWLVEKLMNSDHWRLAREDGAIVETATLKRGPFRLDRPSQFMNAATMTRLAKPPLRLRLGMRARVAECITQRTTRFRP